MSNTVPKMPGHNGQHAPRAMFTNEDVEAIRDLRKSGESAMKIALRFQCNVTTIHRIISNRTYKPGHKNTPVSQAGVHIPSVSQAKGM